MKISIIIPNYNGRHLLEKNLPSVITAAKKCGWQYEIIVADDASKDDSVLFLKKNYPEIIIVENKINGGFSKNINSGIKQAKYNWILALNSDISLDENYFAPQQKYLNDENCFGVMGSIYDEQTKQLIDAAKYPATKGLQVVGTVNYKLQTADSKLKLPSFFLSGANALINRKKLLLLGGFDEIYSPFYQEDLDLGIKAWRMGWSSYYESESKCFHQTSATIQSNFKRKNVSIISNRNKLVLHHLHLNGFNFLLWKALLWLNACIRWCWFDFKFYNYFNAYLQMQPEINQRKLSWNKMIAENKNSLSLPAVIKKIKSQINLPIQKF
jgi:GT2 family glycosyltransferase